MRLGRPIICALCQEWRGQSPEVNLPSTWAALIWFGPVFMEVRLLWVVLVLRLFCGGPICCTSGRRALGLGTSTVLVVMVVDVSKSEYEIICLDMAEAATKDGA